MPSNNERPRLTFDIESGASDTFTVPSSGSYNYRIGSHAGLASNAGISSGSAISLTHASWGPSPSTTRISLEQVADIVDKRKGHKDIVLDLCTLVNRDCYEVRGFNMVSGDVSRLEIGPHHSRTQIIAMVDNLVESLRFDDEGYKVLEGLDE